MLMKFKCKNCGEEFKGTKQNNFIVCNKDDRCEKCGGEIDLDFGFDKDEENNND